MMVLPHKRCTAAIFENWIPTWLIPWAWAHHSAQKQNSLLHQYPYLHASPFKLFSFSSQVFLTYCFTSSLWFLLFTCLPCFVCFFPLICFGGLHPSLFFPCLSPGIFFYCALVNVLFLSFSFLHFFLTSSLQQWCFLTFSPFLVCHSALFALSYLPRLLYVVAFHSSTSLPLSRFSFLFPVASVFSLSHSLFCFAFLFIVLVLHSSTRMSPPQTAPGSLPITSPLLFFLCASILTLIYSFSLLPTSINACVCVFMQILSLDVFLFKIPCWCAAQCV